MNTPDIAIAPELPDVTAPEGERKTVTALFADIKGSTELMRDLDPEDARAIVDPALGLMIQAVRRFDGHIVQSTGDGIFVVFGAPIAYEDHPQRAIHAALAMQQALKDYGSKLAVQRGATLEARVGINTGEVVLREIPTGGHSEYAPIGHTANLAARLQAIAPSGSIAVSDQTRGLVQGYFELRPLGAVLVKGLSAPVNAYEVTGPGLLQGHFQVAVERGLAKFVGRQHEIEEIGRALELARAGRGQIVAIIGEPGVGKSRLLHQFKQTRPHEWLMLEAGGFSHGAGVPYHLVVELLHNYFRLLHEDTQQQRRDKIDRKLVERGLQDTAPYLFPLLGLPWDALNQESDPELRKRRTIDAVKRLFLMESRSQPLLLVCEDLHWLDRESLLFLSVMSSSIPTAQILGLVSFRPEFRHEFGNRSYFTQIHLHPLDAEETRDKLRSQLGAGTVPSELEQFVVMKSEGNPLFIEEILQALFDQGVLVRGDTGSLARPLSGIRIPATIQSIIASRVDRLAAEQKTLLQAMAVIGRKSTLSLLKRVVLWPDQQLEQILTRLRFLEFIYEQSSMFDEPEYMFKHALTQDVAYNSLLREKRGLLHERAAQAVETLYAEQLDDHVGELAHHYGHAGNAEKAVQYLQMAGRQALARSAVFNGISHLTEALALLESQQVANDKTQQELQLRLLLGPALMASEGFASPKVEQVYSRARELCAIVGDASQLCAVLYGLFGIHNARSSYAIADELTIEMIRIADNLKDPFFCTLAFFSAGQTQFLIGEPRRSHGHFERAGDFYSPERQRELTLLAGFDCGIAGMAWDSLAMWMLGYPEQAQSKVEDAVALAQEFGHPHTLVYALSFRAWLRHFRREWRSAFEDAQRVGALADEHGLPLWRLWAIALGGTALVEEGKTYEGRDQLIGALEGMRAAGAGITMTQTLGLIAQAHACCADPSQGLAAVDEALATVETSNERYYWAELNRVRAELLLISEPSNIPEAERCLFVSIDIARQQHARCWELRATSGLARVLMRQGQTERARRLLAEIYTKFTEGFDTADLKEAKALLDELSR